MTGASGAAAGPALDDEVPTTSAASPDRDSASAEVEARPYRGVESYEAEDGDLFFGRDLEAQRLVAKILSGRTTILYAPSGAGKSSLLNARVTPDLEAHGWTAIRARPEANPVVAVRDAALRTVVFDPDVEAAALAGALGATMPPGSTPTLADLVAVFDDLKPNDPARRQAMERVTLPAEREGGSSAPGRDGRPRTSFLSRLLRASITLERYVAHLSMLARWIPPAIEADAFSGATPVSTLLRLLRDPDIREAHSDFACNLILPVPGLAPFFVNLWETYSECGINLDFVLIVDQFEELFTLFVDRDGEVEARFSRPDHRLRRLFFEQLHELYRLRLPAAAGRLNPEEEARGDFPLRLVLALREEYLGRLGPIRSIVPEFDERTTRLAFLSIEEARRAIAEPARRFGYSYSGDCLREILEGLVREKELGPNDEIESGFVEPTALQIVCDKLWDSVVRRELSEGKGDRFEVQLEEMQHLVGAADFKPGQLVAHILADFFSARLRELEPAEQTEALDLLEQLITGGRTRNIVEQSTLLAAPFRNRKVRESALDKLVAARILRSEPKLGSLFVEITHEFLIPAILEETRLYLLKNPDVLRLRSAIRILERRIGVEASQSGGVMGRSEFLLVDGCRHFIQWTSLAVEEMLRGAIVLGVDRPRLCYWVELYRAAAGEESGASFGETKNPSSWRVFLARLAERQDLDATELEVMLRGAIRWCRDDERETIRTWTRRALEHGLRTAADH